jgi:WD40 repeat protein
VSTLYGHIISVTDLVLLEKDLNLLASSSEDLTIIVWNYETGEQLNTLNGHSNFINSLVMLRNGLLASCSLDATIRIWNYTSGQTKLILTGHTEDISAIVLLRNGYLASASLDASIKIWYFTNQSDFNSSISNIQYLV